MTNDIFPIFSFFHFSQLLSHSVSKDLLYPPSFGTIINSSNQKFDLSRISNVPNYSTSRRMTYQNKFLLTEQFGLSLLQLAFRSCQYVNLRYRYFIADNVLDEITFGWPRQKVSIQSKEQLAFKLQRAFNWVFLLWRVHSLLLLSLVSWYLLLFAISFYISSSGAIHFALYDGT